MMKTNIQKQWRRYLGAMLFFFQVSVVAFAQESGVRRSSVLTAG